MDREKIVRQYLVSMEMGDLEATCACFSDGATVTSPVYGSMPIRPFYERLYGDTRAAKVDIRDIFSSVGNADHWGAHFDYKWTRHDGTSLSSSLVDIFRFVPGMEKIEHLEIIFDRSAIK